MYARACICYVCIGKSMCIRLNVSYDVGWRRYDRDDGKVSPYAALLSVRNRLSRSLPKSDLVEARHRWGELLGIRRAFKEAFAQIELFGGFPNSLVLDLWPVLPIDIDVKLITGRLRRAVRCVGRRANVNKLIMRAETSALRRTSEKSQSQMELPCT